MQVPDAEVLRQARMGQILGEAGDKVSAPGGEGEDMGVAFRGPEAEMTDDDREALAAHYIRLSGNDMHTSLCATSRAPAVEPGECDCGGWGRGPQARPLVSSGDMPKQ